MSNTGWFASTIRLVCAGLLLGLVWVLAPSPLQAAVENSHDLIVSGNRAFHDGAFDEAISLYRRAQDLGDTSGRLSFNLGVAYYRVKNYKAAALAFRASARDDALAAQSW